MYEWSLRNEVYTALHRWPMILFYGLVGCFLGLILSLVLPSPWRATAEIYVGFEPYRWSEDENVMAYALGTRFNFADDYKNWQMSQLDLLTGAPDVLAETLTRLQTQDAYGQSTSLEDLQYSLHASWRNTGVWRLVASHEQPERAAQPDSDHQRARV